MTVIVTGSGVGVRMAANTKQSRNAYLKLRMRNCGEATPIRARKKTRVGSWKMTPQASTSRTYRLNASCSRGVNSTYSFSAPKPAKNAQATWNRM